MNESSPNNSKNMEIIIWEDKYSTGVKLIDSQHQQLFDLTNQLYLACFAGDDVLNTVFHDTMHKMVEYVHFHFSTELKLLNKIDFPDYKNHKKLHDELIRDILEVAKEFKEDKKFIPNNFVRTLKDWILSHIGVYDKIYAGYIAEQKRRGVLTERMLNEMDLSVT